MRLRDKLVRRNCPSCGAAISLGGSNLDKKINCPKCRESVVIPSAEVPPEKPAHENPSREKPLTKEPARSTIAREFPAPGEPSLVTQSRYVEEPPIPEVRIPIEPGLEPESVDPMDDSGDESGTVIYCLCNGVLKKRRTSIGASGSLRGVCCMYLKVPAS